MATYKDYKVFKEVVEMSKEFRKSISQMPKEARYDIGNEIRSLLRDIKYNVYLFVTNISTRPKDCYLYKLSNNLHKLEILIDECLEDNLLLIKGPYTIFMPRKRLMDVVEEIDTQINTQR